jgi:hypothetical protein
MDQPPPPTSRYRSWKKNISGDVKIIKYTQDFSEVI